MVLAALAGPSLAVPLRAAVSVTSTDIALYGDPSSHQVGLYTAPTYSLPNASFTYPGSPTYASTSRFVVNVDGLAYDYSSALGGIMTASGSGLGASLDGSKTVGGIQVSCHYEIVANPQTGIQPDTMMMQFTLCNTGGVSHAVGARLEIDTDVNGVDGANVSADNGVSVHTVGTVYRKNSANIPGNWWIYDIPPPPPTAANLVGRGSLFGNPYGPPATMPDVFEVTSWSSVEGNGQWSIGDTGSSIFDSSVVYWWTGTGSENGPNQSLAPGACRTIRTYYGIDRGVLLSTFTPTPVPGSPTVTPTESPSRTITSTFSVTATFSASPTETPSRTVTQSFTHTPTLTNSATPTPSRTVTSTFTHSPTATPTASPTPTPTATASFTNTPSSTVTPTASPTPTITETFTITPTFTDSPTATITRTPIGQDRLLTVRAQYPVPFNTGLSVYYVLLDDAELSVRFYNVAGELVWDHLENGSMGGNLMKWDGVNDSGGHLASGVYIGRFYARSSNATDEAWIRTAIER